MCFFGFIFASYVGPKTAQNLAHMGHFSHTHESTHNIPVNQV